jgi:hypothetical protein
LAFTSPARPPAACIPQAVVDRHYWGSASVVTFICARCSFMVRVRRLLPRSAERPSIPGWPVCCIGVIRTSQRLRWRTRTPARCGRYLPTTGSSGPTTSLRRQRSRFNAANATRRSFHRLLRRSRSDGMKGKTVVGKAQNDRSTSSARERMRSQPAHSIRDSGNAARKVRMYLPYESSRTESLANRGRPCTVIGVTICLAPG